MFVVHNSNIQRKYATDTFQKGLKSLSNTLTIANNFKKPVMQRVSPFPKPAVSSSFSGQLGGEKSHFL